jgi:hypothetical protein
MQTDTPISRMDDVRTMYSRPDLFSNHAQGSEAMVPTVDPGNAALAERLRPVLRARPCAVRRFDFWHLGPDRVQVKLNSAAIEPVCRTMDTCCAQWQLTSGNGPVSQRRTVGLGTGVTDPVDSDALAASNTRTTWAPSRTSRESSRVPSRACTTSESSMRP